MTERTHLPNRRLNQTQEINRDGIKITMTIGFKPDGISVGEIFLNADRANSMLDVLMSDAAIICSLALQHGVPLAHITHAIKRDQFGLASSPIGAALDRISVPEVLK
jgi:hypothetical protein